MKTRPVLWSQLTLFDLETVNFQSIKDAVTRLKEKNGLWSSEAFTGHRRSQLIQEQVTKKHKVDFEFLKKPTAKKWGFFCLTDQNTMLASASTTSPFPKNEIHFAEDKAAPSRAYLKLWEALTLHSPRTDFGRVIDLGSSPGGWTWVLSQRAQKVFSVDKAPLDPKLSKIKNIEWKSADAFKIDPLQYPNLDCVFSDIICFPERLLELAHRWIESGVSRNFLLTVKFRGPCDFELLEKFRAIPDSKLVHLFHNKHEVTFMKFEP